jgi:K+-dependent Na+/Ca+ exchanger-like protein
MTADAHSIIGIVFGGCECTDTFKCSSTIDANGGVVIWLAILLYMFKALGTVCDEYFVPSLEQISEKLELSNDVAGATFMAAGSSAPELFTSLVATFLIVNEGGVGAIIGSAIFNILVIVGATCIFAGRELKIWWYPLARDVTFYVIAIIELSIALGDSEVMWWEALMMFMTYIFYIIFMKQNHHIVKRLGGNPSDNVIEDMEDPEIQKPEPEAAEKSEKPEAAEKPEKSVDLRAAAKDEEAGAASQPEPMPKAQAQSGNPNSPDYEDEDVTKENSSKPLEPETKAIASKKQAEDLESPVAESAPDVEKLHTGNKLACPGADFATRSGPPSSPRDAGEGSHHVWMSMRELHDHKGLDKDGNGEECTGATGSAAVASKGLEAEKAEESEERRCSIPDPLNKFWELTMPTPENYWRLFSASIANIAVCTYVMVDAVNRTGCNLNIQPLIMGLIFLAAGTSVPDALGSIAVAKQGEGDMAVANAFGSNVFDILLGLGVPWFLSTACIGTRVVFPGAGGQLIEWILILTVILVAFIAALAYNRMRLNQMMGAILMTLYLVYVVVALVRAFAFK